MADDIDMMDFDMDSAIAMDQEQFYGQQASSSSSSNPFVQTSHNPFLMPADDPSLPPAAKRPKLQVEDFGIIDNDTSNIVSNHMSMDYSAWRRPELPPSYLQGLPQLTFMQVDLDDYLDRPHAFYCQTKNSLVPVLRMYWLSF